MERIESEKAAEGNVEQKEQSEGEDQQTPVDEDDQAQSQEPQSQEAQENTQLQQQNPQNSQEHTTNLHRYQSPRYKRLVTSSSTALAHAVKSLTYKRVAACYPSIASTPGGQNALRDALKQICKAWQDSVQTEFSAIFEERHLHEKLLQLDQLVKEAKFRMQSNTELPIHVDKLTPDQIVKSHLRETKLAQIKKLKQQIETVKKKNETYRRKINEDSERVHASLDKLHKVTSDVSKATDASQEMPERAELYEFWTTN